VTCWPGISDRVLRWLGGFLAKAFAACGAVSQTGSLTILVAGISHHVEAPAEGFNVARDDLERGRLPVLDLGYLGDAHARRFGGISLRQTELLERLGELTFLASASNLHAPASISAGETPAACSSCTRVSQSCGILFGMSNPLSTAKAPILPTPNVHSRRPAASVTPAGSAACRRKSWLLKPGQV
jgi:hypothetical protein